MKYPIKTSNKTRCQICGKEMKMINNKHLLSHNITMNEYKTQYPNVPTLSEELLLKFKERSIKANENRKGVKRTKKEKENISKGIKESNKKTGYIVHNKGKPMSDEQKLKLITKAKERKENGWISPSLGKIKSNETKEKIRKSVINYAKNNKDLLKERGLKSVKTKIKNNYYNNKRINTINSKIALYEQHNFECLEYDNNLCNLKCNKCNTIHSRSFDSVIHENMCPNCRNTGISKPEKEIYDFIKNDLKINCELSNKTLLNGFELDILIPDYKLAIEFDGLYWHSEKMGKGKFYHSTKTNKTNENGYKLIHIFEDEWRDKKELVKSRIKNLLNLNKTKIYARKCYIKEISNKDVKEFFDLNHIQGHFNSSIILGLYYKDQLVSAMSFSKMNPTKGKNNYEYELSRFCSNKDISVIGGASKLFKYFIKHYSPLSILTYSDVRWNTGSVYKVLGFTEVGKTIPNYWYIKNGQRYHRFKFTKKKLIEMGYDSSKTEAEIMSELGYDKIYDCGHLKYEWFIAN